MSLIEDQLCSSFPEEQNLKIKNRRRYDRKQKLDLSKDNLDLLGNLDLEEVFSGSHEHLENTPQQYSSPPRPQYLCLQALSIKTPHNVSPTLGTALQHKIKKSLGFTVEHPPIMETLQSLRDKIKSVKKHNSEVGVDQISASVNPKPGPSKQPDLQKSPSTSHTSTKPLDKPMETDFVGPHLPPQFAQRFESEIPSDVNSEQSKHFAVAKPQKHWDKRKHKAVTSSSSSEKSEASVHVQGGFFCT